MSRPLGVAAAQIGPVAEDEPREAVVARLVALLEEAADRGAELVVFPELALTPYFPRGPVDEARRAARFEASLPSPATQPLFDAAARRGTGFYLGFGERTIDADGTVHHYNSAALTGPDGEVIAVYRKVHLPGSAEPRADAPVQILEPAHFEPGPDGFAVHDAFGGRIGMLICYDRRWPEPYRVLGLQGVELIAIGYTTPLAYETLPHVARLSPMHHTLAMAAGAYQNATWVVAAGRGGTEGGIEHLPDSQIIAPSGEVVAKSVTRGDEVVVAVCDLDMATEWKKYVQLDKRAIEHYASLVQPQAIAVTTPSEETE